MKRWKKSVVELKTDGAPLLESIIHQLKDLREAYSGDYPLGFITLNTEEYKRLKILCGRYVLSPPTQLTPYNSLIMSLTMVQFAIKEKKTDDFWRDFFASYRTDDNQLRRSVFCKALVLFCVNEGLYFHYTNGKRRYVETIKTHAVISEYTITNVMGAVRLYYQEEMHEIYSEETAGYYTNKFIGIMKKSLENENTSSRLYSIPMAFRTACSVFENALYDSVSNTLFNMNSANYRENSYRKTPAAFYAHYRHWIIIDEIRRRNKLRKASSAAVDKRNIRHYTKAAYSLGNDLAFLLHIPRLEIPEEMIYKNIVLKIYDDFAEVFDLRQELNVSGMFKFHTEEIIVKLPCFYKKLSYRITADEYVIYDSAEVMYRNYIVFDGNFEEYRSTKVPEEIFFLMTAPKDSVLLDCYSEIKRNDTIRIYSLSAEKDSDLYVNSSPVFRTFGDDSLNITLLGGENVKEARVIIAGTSFHAWKTLPEIQLGFQNKNILEDYTFELVSENSTEGFSLSDVVSEKKCIRLTDFAENTDELHLLIKNKSGKIIWDYPMFYIPGYTSTFGKEYYYRDKYAELLDIASDHLDFGNNEFPIFCEAKKDTYMYLDADQNGKNVRVRLRPPVISWYISDEINSDKGIYIPDADLQSNSALKVYVPFGDYRVIAVFNGRIRNVPFKNGKADMSVFKGSQEDYTDIGLFYHDKPVKLFEIIHRPCIREFRLNTLEQGKKIEISYQLIGEANVVITAFHSAQGIEAEIFRSDTSANCVIDFDLPSGQYRLAVEIEESDEFGFETQRRFAESRNIYVGDEFEIFSSDISELEINRCIIDEEKTVRNFYIKNIQKQVDEYMYTGTAYFYAQSRRTGDFYQQEFKQANPVIIRVIESSDTEYKVLITDSEYDGFLYDKNKKYLVYDSNGIKDKYSYDVPDIYLIGKSRRSDRN